MKKLIILFVLLVPMHQILAQKLKLEKVADSAAVWCRGSVELEDGEKLTGLLRYNKMTAVLQFENNAVSKSLTPESVLRFSFYDSLQKKNRRFITYGFEDLNAYGDLIGRAKNITPIEMPRQFFEILMEFSTFAVLHNTGSIKIFTRGAKANIVFLFSGLWGTATVSPPVTTYTQTEMLYIFDKDGKATLFWMALHRERDAVIVDGKLTMNFSKIVDIVMQRYTEPYFYQIDDWAYENNLSYDKKEDILKMFEYYQTLIKG